MTIYVLSGFNNYYNRIVKKFDTVEEYLPYELHMQQNFNFVSNDNVNTQVVLGSNVNLYDGTGDYLLVVNEFNEIVSRWFIIESVRDRAGQYTLTLHRDLVVDHYNELLDEPMFIEKATLPTNSNLIFNTENMTVNQIKTSETLLKDETQCPWIIGYYAKNAQDFNGNVSLPNFESESVINLGTNLESWEYYKYVTDYFKTKPTVASVNIKYSVPNSNYGLRREISLVSNDTNFDYISQSEDDFYLEMNDFSPDQSTYAYLRDQFDTYFTNHNWREKMLGHLKKLYDWLDDDEVNTINDLQGKILITSDNKIYKIKLSSPSSDPFDVFRHFVPVGSDLQTELIDFVKSFIVDYSDSRLYYWYIPAGNTDYKNKDNYTYTAISPRYKIVLEELSSNNAVPTYNLNGAKNETIDQPYNIFAIPYGEVTVKNANDEVLVVTNKDYSLAIANAIAVQQGSKVYDIQLLPYFPQRNMITGEKEITFTDSKQCSLVTALIESSWTNFGAIFNISNSNFDFKIFETFNSGTTNIEKKINNQCDKWRLTSPNYSNYFDFSVEKNNGITNFDVDCSYKPYSPYIHINPDFKNLYGYDDNSPRGLVLGGDFSISRISDKWEEYQIQNKYYQETFDRQIQNMEVQHDIARKQDIWSVIAGAGSGGASGSLVGSMIGGGGAIGTAIGGTIGAGLSIAGGIADIKYNEKLRSEAINYKEDQFGYQLATIQALPQTISKVSAFNKNNKIFPVLEYYTCTDEEKKAFVNKIAYNGMTVGAIGKMSKYIGNYWSYTIDGETIESKGYIKGKLIRLEAVEDDYHIINALSSELDKGVYIRR